MPKGMSLQHTVNHRYFGSTTIQWSHLTRKRTNTSSDQQHPVRKLPSSRVLERESETDFLQFVVEEESLYVCVKETTFEGINSTVERKSSRERSKRKDWSESQDWKKVNACKKKKPFDFERVLQNSLRTLWYNFSLSRDFWGLFSLFSLSREVSLPLTPLARLDKRMFLQPNGLAFHITIFFS